MKRSRLPSVACLCFVLLLAAGCAPKPRVEPPPEPMTKAYLIDHTVQIDAPEGRVLRLPTYHYTAPFAEGNATLSVTLSATLHADRPVEGTLFFTLEAPCWGAFDAAVDTAGGRRDVTPYTSGIRQGRFFERFYVTVDRDWLGAMRAADNSVLLIGKTNEFLFPLPAVYPDALITLIDAQPSP